MKSIWLWNHYATNMFFEKGGRHYNFAKNLLKCGYAPTIFCASTEHNSARQIEIGNGLFKEESADGINFVFVKAPQYKGNGFSRIKNMLAFALRLKKTAAKIAKTSKPDVILASSPSPFVSFTGILTAKKLKIPCIAEVRDLWPESIVDYNGNSRYNPAVMALYSLEKWIYKKADRLIFTIAGGADYIRDKGWDKSIDMNKVYHINNGVDLDQYKENINLNSFADTDLDNESVFKAVYVGSLRPANDLTAILDAAKILCDNPEIRFLIWGDGSERKRLEQRMLDENIHNVVFKGRVDKKYISYILGKSGLNILHYVNHPVQRYGGSQNKLFEYFASGRPVFCDINVGHNLITKYKAGITVDSQEPHVIADAVLKIASMPKEEYDEYCANALRAASDYDFKVLTNQLIDIIEGVV